MQFLERVNDVGMHRQHNKTYPYTSFSNGPKPFIIDIFAMDGSTNLQ